MGLTFLPEPGSTGFLIVCLAALWLFVNLLTYTAFGLDKSRARRGGWRVPERTLLMLAFLGGWPAAKVAQRQFRHKTRKRPFARKLNQVPILWAALFVLASGAFHVPVSGRLEAGLAGLSGWFEEGLASIASSEAREEARPFPRRFGPGSHNDP